MFDLSLLYTIGLIFAATLLGSYLRSRRKDVCLNSFEGYHVTIERTDNKIAWGALELASTGLELLYRDGVQDAQHMESSYILYGEEYGTIQAIYRYADQLSPENKLNRERDIERSFHPGPLERSKRGLRKFVGTASESINEVLTVILGRAKKPAGRYINDDSEKSLFRLGENLIGHAGGIFDPLLERFIGQKMVVEIMEGNEVHEHVGIFKNYSPDFIEILDVQFPQKQALPLGPDGLVSDDTLQVTVEGNKLTVANPGTQPVLIQSLHVDAQETLINAVVNGGESVELFVEGVLAQAVLHVRVVRELDMIVPRTRSLLRHRAEHFHREQLTDIIFDVGILLSPDRRQQEQERRLRAALAEDANDGLAAANLGSILLKKKEYAEARKWIMRALEVRYSLPDNGQRAEIQLRELNRKGHRHSSAGSLTQVQAVGQ